MMLTPRTITIHYLEMTSPAQLRPKSLDPHVVSFTCVLPPWPELNRFLYSAVGADWYWTDRLSWTRDQWRAHLERPQHETWILTHHDLPAGYVELELQTDLNTEIAYFGLLHRAIGHGLGAHLLTAAARRAWDLGANRVWLHTCSLDHPAALPNYIARGFRVYRTETLTKSLPSSPPALWPGWRVS